MRCYILYLLFVLFAITGAAQHKVLIIGIDGCRGDAIVAANAPRLDSLRNSGYQTLYGNTHPPTWSGTGWSTMLTGVWEQKHKVVENTFSNQQFATWPHFFALIRSSAPTLNLVSIAHWAPINTIITTQADQEINVATDQLVADNGVDQLLNGDPDVLFLDFDDVDHAGHSFGFTPTTPQYLAAIETVDAQLGPVMAALATRPTSEEWLVYVTTDHGGTASGHGGITPIEQRIFAFVSAPGLPPSVQPEVTNTVTMPSVVSLTANKYVRVNDPTPYRFGAAQDFTIECRVKMPTTWVGDPAFVCDKNWNSGLNKGYVLSTPTSGVNWKFNIADAVDRIDLTGLPINDNAWHHIAVTCDRDGEVRIFQDGLLLRSASMSVIGDVDTGLPLCFGQDGTTTYGSPLTGSMAEVRIWNAALPINTISEWSGKSLSTLHPFNASLIGHWRMDEGSGGVIANSVDGAPAAQHYTSAVQSNATWLAAAGTLSCVALSRSPVQADLVPTVLAHLCIANDPGWQLDGRSLVPVCAPVTVQARTFLDGPFDVATGSMSDSLRYHGLLPLSEPYTALGFDRAGVGGETMAANALDADGPDAIVDWVLLEARATDDPSRIESTRACLLQRDGDVVDVDGVSDPRWALVLGDHHLAVRHRNHLGVMTSAPLSFLSSTSTAIDLTGIGADLFGTEAMHTVGATRRQWKGNAVNDGAVLYTGDGSDRDLILQAIGGVVPTYFVSGYRQEDTNMDGTVRYTGARNDRDEVLQTIGGVVPTDTRVEQLP